MHPPPPPRLPGEAITGTLEIDGVERDIYVCAVKSVFARITSLLQVVRATLHLIIIFY